MTVQQFSGYEAPSRGPHRKLVPSIVSDAGEVLLVPNRRGFGFSLKDGAEGFGQSDVENELVPREGRRGAKLGGQRELDGDMFIPIQVKSTTNTEVRRLVAELGAALRPANGMVKLVLSDPATGVGRYRNVAYKSGLDTPDWRSPVAARYGIVVEYADPWAYSLVEGERTLSTAPGASGGLTVPVEFPIAFATSGAVRERWATNEGDLPAPVTLRFDGPVTNPEVSLQGYWTFRVQTTLAWDEYLIIDPIGGTSKIYTTTGSGFRTDYSVIRAGSKFSDLELPPGQHALSYRAVDPTYTSSVTVTWPHTFRSME